MLVEPVGKDFRQVDGLPKLALGRNLRMQSPEICHQVAVKYGARRALWIIVIERFGIEGEGLMLECAKQGFHIALERAKEIKFARPSGLFENESLRQIALQYGRGRAKADAMVLD